MHVLCDGYGIQSGLSRFAEVTWYLTTPFKEFWVITPDGPANQPT